MPNVSAYAAFDSKSPLGPHTIRRRDPGPRDVVIEIQFCGVCHSDLHTVRSEWSGGTSYPCVPGHEIVGIVSAVGAKVSKFAQGDRAGVGCIVDSCRTCASCREGLEQYCEQAVVWTYNSRDPHGTAPVTYGGYSSSIVVDEAYCVSVPASLDLAGAAPLLCAGITTYSPLRHWNAGPGRRVGVVGIGGLGHMAVKLSHALGAETIAFTSSKVKVEEAHRLGATSAVVTRDKAAMRGLRASFDIIIDTVSVSHDLDAYTSLLARDGTLVLVGAPQDDHPSPSVERLVKRRRAIAGSLVGGIAETQEMLDFCAEHRIAADIELIRMEQINEAYERMLRGDVRYRFVIEL